MDQSEERTREVMTPAQRQIWLISLVGAAIVTGVWWMLSRSLPEPAELVAQPEPAAVVEREEPTPTPSLYEVTENAPDDAPVDRNEARPEPGDGELPLGHALRSVIAANEAELRLEPAEIDRLTEDYLEFQEVHTELISRFLQETAFDPTAVSLRVPAFPVEGKALRDLFYQRLRNDFPGDKYERILANLGNYLEATFQGFGVAEQTIVVTRSTSAPGNFEIRWEAKVPEGQSGHSGIPDVSFAGSSGHAMFSREQIKSGEYRFLGSVIDMRFPGP